MHKTLQKYCNSRNYRQILKIVESKTSNPSQIYKNIVLDDSVVELKEFILKSIMEHIYDRKKIPIHLFKLSDLFDENFRLHTRVSVSNYLITREITNISEYAVQILDDLSNLKDVFKYIESRIEEFTTSNDDLPFDWNLDLKILSKSIIMLKKLLCEFFYTKKFGIAAFSLGFIAVLNFEERSKPFFESKKCCLDDSNNEITLYGEDGFKPECIHKNMLSTIFTPNINLFYEYMLTPQIDIDQFKVQNNIYYGYIDYFKRLENLYLRMQLLSDKKLMVTLFQVADNILKLKIQGLVPKVDPSSIIYSISTLLYVQETFEEFYLQIINTTDFECVDSFTSIGCLSIEESIYKAASTYFEQNIIIKSELVSIVECFQTMFHCELEATHNACMFVVEAGMACIFGKISQIKMNKKNCTIILSEMAKLDRLLINNGLKKVSYMKIIFEYLEVFLDIDQPKEVFFNSVDKIKTKFNLSYILKALEDQDYAQELYNYSQQK